MLNRPPVNNIVATQAGGAFAKGKNDDIFFSIGDFGSYSAAQNINSTYGKIYKYDGSRVSVFAIGVRNPQGLYFDNIRDLLFETEHGPKGGDEINEIHQGDNLGWPISTYGIDYGATGVEKYTPLPGQEKWGTHDFGKLPIFAYVPAVAPTAITVVHDGIFRQWVGSIIHASLRGNSIFRVFYEPGDSIFGVFYNTGHGTYSEAIINLKSRIRFLRQAGDGTLYAKSDPNIFYIIQPDWPGIRREDTDLDGEDSTAYEAGKCAHCHLPHESHSGIPNIYGLNKSVFIEAINRMISSTTRDERMVAIAKELTENQKLLLAKYFEKR